jgi:iron complex outermembrane receptor protein
MTQAMRAAAAALALGVSVVISGQAQDAVTGAEPIVVTGSAIFARDVTSVAAQIETDRALADALSRRAANFLINEAGATSFNDVYAVRGLANTPNFSKQAVVVYVDDVPSSSTFTNFTDLLSPSQIDLFRGPQGDLFGKNAEAGVINIRTFVPDETPRLFASATLGDYDARRFSATAAGPVIGETLFMKVDLLASHRDGYLRNVFRGTRPDYENHVAGRVVARLLLRSDLEIVASVAVHNSRDGVQRFVPLEGDDPFEVEFDFDGRTRIQGDSEALRVAQTFGDVRLISITSRRDWRLSPYEADFDYSPVPFVRGRFQLRQTQLAQELRLEPVTRDGELDWRIGIFADRVRTNGDELFALTGFEKRIAFVDREHHVAAFGRVTRRFGAWEALGGMRVEYTTNGIDRTRVETFSPRESFTSERAEWNAQPKLGLRYHWSQDGSVYAQSSYGYKSGGFFVSRDRSAARELRHRAGLVQRTGRRRRVRRQTSDGACRGVLQRGFGLPGGAPFDPARHHRRERAARRELGWGTRDNCGPARRLRSSGGTRLHPS